MSLNRKASAFALALTTVLIWTVCSVLIWLIPQSMMNMGGDIMHTQSDQMMVSMNFGSYLVGLIVWAIGAAVTGWIWAHLYNHFGDNSETQK